jgi:GT2 family glycosyltransferase
MAKDGADLAVITVGTNDGNWLRACLATLSRSSYTRLAVFYADNASTDGSRDVARSFPGVTVLELRDNRGAAPANNAALAAAFATLPALEYVLFLNPDTRTPPDLLERMIAWMAQHPSYGAVGPLQYRYGGEPICSLGLNEWSEAALRWGERGEFSHRVRGRTAAAGQPAGRAPHTLEHHYVQSSALLVRADALGDAGFLDEHYETYYEELDLCRRVRWCGHRVALLLDFGIEHVGGGNTRGSAYRDERMLRNKYYYLWCDPTWGALDTARLTTSWLRTDLRRLARPARHDDVRVTIGTAARALVWLAGSIPRTARIRHRYRELRARHAAARRQVYEPTGTG